jgi:hypothetical protein
MSTRLNLGNLLLIREHNIDETGVSTSVQSPNIVALLGTKHGQAISG